MSIIAREVEFARDEPAQIYHAVDQVDYIAILALTRAGKLPIVRQYRPALEAFSWELPAGLVDPGEDPADTCRRELLEEIAQEISQAGGRALALPADVTSADEVRAAVAELRRQFGQRVRSEHAQ